MKAVQKFDADKGIRLISYAVWWIRAFIQNYILKSWSLVKLGTTQAQRKLFFSLARTRRELEKFDGAEQAGADEKAIARKLRVKPGEVIEMQQRMEGRDPRERYIIEMRVMQDKPMTLKELGEPSASPGSAPASSRSAPRPSWSPS